MRPGRDGSRQRGGPGDVGVLVGGDVEPLGAGLLDALDDLVHPAPHVFSGDLQMKNFHRDIGLPSDGERLIQSVKDRAPFAAHVGGVDAAVPGGGVGQRYQFVRPGVVGRGINERTRQPQRTLLHGVFDQALHLGQLFGRGSAVLRAQHHPAHLGGADVAAQIDSGAPALEAGEIAGEVAPIHLHAEAGHERVEFVQGAIVLGSGRPAFAGDLGGDALADFAFRGGVDQQVEFRLAQHIDEAGSHHQAGRINHPASRGPAQVAASHDAVAAHGHILPRPRIPAAVHQPAAHDQQVIRIGGRLAGRQENTHQRQAESQTQQRRIVLFHRSDLRENYAGTGRLVPFQLVEPIVSSFKPSSGWAEVPPQRCRN